MPAVIWSWRLRAGSVPAIWRLLLRSGSAFDLAVEVPYFPLAIWHLRLRSGSAPAIWHLLALAVEAR